MLQSSDGSAPVATSPPVEDPVARRIEVLAGLGAGEHIALDPVRAGIYLKSTVARQGDD